MTKKADSTNVNIFWLELTLAVMIPFIIIWRSIPTNVLNSKFLLIDFQTIGIFGSIIIFFVGIPAGIIGIKKAKKMERLQKPTVIFSVINLLSGIFEVLILLLIFGAVIFGGVSA